MNFFSCMTEASASLPRPKQRSRRGCGLDLVSSTIMGTLLCTDRNGLWSGSHQCSPLKQAAARNLARLAIKGTDQIRRLVPMDKSRCFPRNETAPPYAQLCLLLKF